MSLALYIVLLGGRPPHRHIEQHDVYFGVGESLPDLVPGIRAFWPEAKGNLHVDGYMRVDHIDGYEVSLVLKTEETVSSPKLFFINLGGYRQGEFEELHQKLLIVADGMPAALRQAKKHTFFVQGQDVGNNGKPHIDDKYLLEMEADDVIDLSAMLAEKGYCLVLRPGAEIHQPEPVMGYFRLDKLSSMR